MQIQSLPPLSIDTYFDRVFYINLEKDVARNEHMIRQFEKYRINNYERIEAIELPELPEAAGYRNFIKNEPKYIIGQLSCRASHVKCMKTAKERKYKTVLILEDDALFLQNPNTLLLQNYHVLQDWDMLYFGGVIEPPFRNQIVCAHAYAIRDKLYDDIINMADASGMEIDNFYAKILQHMSYNYNSTGTYNIRIILPFNQIIQSNAFASNIQEIVR